MNRSRPIPIIRHVAMAVAITCWPAYGLRNSLAQDAERQHTGTFYILTTSDGANLPASAREVNFPLLVRLDAETFDFSQAADDGSDLRFATASGEPLSFHIEEWNAIAESACVWVRIPEIRGNAHQQIRMYWGNSNATHESSAESVFGPINGHVSVWHLGDKVVDEVGTLQAKDTGTTAVRGMIGGARHFPGSKGIFLGDQIIALPAGESVHTSQAWFRPLSASGRVLGWGNEKAQGKVILQYRSPPQVQMECYFSDANVNGDVTSPMADWIHAVHTYRRGESLLYIDGKLVATGNPLATALNLERPARMWLGGWYDHYGFQGDIDEVRVSNVIRSPAWIRLEFENQKPLQTLVGALVPSGRDFDVSQRRVVMAEGDSITLTAKAGGAEKVYWSLSGQSPAASQTSQQPANEPTAQAASVVAVDHLRYTFAAGRISADQSRMLQFKAVYANQVKQIEIPITIKEAIPEPIVSLDAPAQWDGREIIAIAVRIANLAELHASNVADVQVRWRVEGLAVTKQIDGQQLILQRAQNSGRLIVSATISNGGDEVVAQTEIDVAEPGHDPWIARIPDDSERPVDHQFFARNDNNQGTLLYRGTEDGSAESVFLRVYADGALFASENQPLRADRTYAFAVSLKPGLIKYRTEFGTVWRGNEQITHTASDLVCGDAFLIEGQSNALATDTGDEAPAETVDWIRSYGSPTGDDDEANLWCNPVWKAQNGEKAELGYWGMELAKRLLKSQQVPICIINGAVGGTRIDQHQRNENDPTDVNTIYGRLLWRVRQAKLTHGIRAILWHQGENDQGADGPDGGYGWQTYEKYFVEMSAAWKRDFPNLQHYYLFQIWPNACSMGNGNGDMLREVQRKLQRLYSKMDIMSTLGIHPPGGCHYPLEGWAEFARLIQPLIERDLYGQQPSAPVTAPNLQLASYTDSGRQTIALEFDQEVVWDDRLADQFYLDDVAGMIASGSVVGNWLTLTLKERSDATKISYLKEMSWNPENLLRGKNQVAALTFCQVPLVEQPNHHD